MEMHFIYLKIYSFLPKIEEMHNLAKLTNASVIGISETKLDRSVLNSATVIEGYDYIRRDRSRK